MGGTSTESAKRQRAEAVLGYLNFSAGATDPQFLAALNQTFAELLEEGNPLDSLWESLGRYLAEQLEQLQRESPAFAEAAQARHVLELVWGHTLPGYLRFHRDQLFHQQPGRLFNALFVGRVCEAVLQQDLRSLSGEGTVREIVAGAIAAGAIAKLNDFVGYRPVAVLERQRLEPYPHERVRPVPLYIEGAGAAHGPYHEVVCGALELLRRADPDLLRAASFAPDRLEELAYDPRAYDFDHPVNKRPNYHFGQWDPDRIDLGGFYRRFVVQQVTLDALLARVEETSELPREERIAEAAAVLAGTILMASGISGEGPETHDSSVSLASLLPEIAAYRDAFYEQLLAQAEGAHGDRLRAEAEQLRQPFGGARQHLNAQLARRRAEQLQEAHLARLYSRMGFAQAAREQAQLVQVASARMLSELAGRLHAVQHATRGREFDRVLAAFEEAEDLLHRAIECGALIDPWNLLGFDGQFPLFGALENSVRDHRIDDLLALLDRLFSLYAQAWSEAAAAGDAAAQQRIAEHFRRAADWWHRYAAHEVRGLEAPNGEEMYRSAEHVARALGLWQSAGAAAGDLAFWAGHADMFGTAKGYVLVIDALLDRGDHVASMALLVHWLSRVEEIPLLSGTSSFHAACERWVDGMVFAAEPAEADALPPSEWEKRFATLRKLFDFLEANAESWWRPPSFRLGPLRGAAQPPESGGPLETEEVEEEGEASLFDAAYEGVVFRDTADDGDEGEVADAGGGDVALDELEAEAQRITRRLLFLVTVARICRRASSAPCCRPGGAAVEETLAQWLATLTENRRGLLELLDQVAAYRLPAPAGEHDALVEYDRRRLVKESLVERVIETAVETANSARYVRAVLAARSPLGDEALLDPTEAGPEGLGPDAPRADRLLGALLRGDLKEVERSWHPFLIVLGRQPLLYIPLAKGGDPRQIMAIRIRQQRLKDLLAWLPQAGLFDKSLALVETARQMERDHPVGLGAVTEFDELFEVGYAALVRSLVECAEHWPEEERQGALVGCLEQLTETFLRSWLAHSRTLRLSVMERVSDENSWRQLVEFIQRYGRDLFTQKFFNLGNVRGILHEGVEAWLEQLEESGEGAETQLLLELDRAIPRRDAVICLTIILEAVIENYAEYRDYNSTTTQSDRGDMLFTLLDFIRLRSGYDRVAWNLRPVTLAHEILVRAGYEEAAELWRRSLAERVLPEAEKFLVKFAALQKKYAMRLPSIAERLSERFLQPLVVDRLRALIGPAMAEAEHGEETPHFDLLRQEARALAQEPQGAGLDLPAWLLALEEEVERVRERGDLEIAELSHVLPQRRLSIEQVHELIELLRASG